jgi:hypothetical protein
MRLMLNTSGYVFEAAKAAEPKLDREHGGIQRQDRETGRPLWIVQVIAKGPDGAEVLNVTVAGDQPKLTPGMTVDLKGLEAIPWAGKDGKSRTAYRAEAVHATATVKAA